MSIENVVGTIKLRDLIGMKLGDSLNMNDFVYEEGEFETLSTLTNKTVYFSAEHNREPDIAICVQQNHDDTISLGNNAIVNSIFVDYERYYGPCIYTAGTGKSYGMIRSNYKSSSSLLNWTSNILYSWGDEYTSSNTQFPHEYATKQSVTFRCGTGSQRFIGKYKWICIWLPVNNPVNTYVPDSGRE